GIFVKEYQALESSKAVDVVVLDKTGTVTTGQMELADMRTADGVSRRDLLRHAGAVEGASEHPVAAAMSAAGGGRPPAARRRVQGAAGSRRTRHRRRPRGPGRPRGAPHRAGRGRPRRPGRPMPGLGAG